MVCLELIASEDVAGMSVREQVERLYEAERRNIYSYVVYLGLPSARAQELTQDAFLKLYLVLSEGKTIQNPLAWLYRVAHNLALRSHTRDQKFDELDPDNEFADKRLDPENALIEKRRAAGDGTIDGRLPRTPFRRKS
jgi:RNA polymerase sigma-70 factor (ECF subfamily)